MSIREDLVSSAAKFLQDPSVSSSPPESRVAFLKAKNLTPEEINAALSRAGLDGGAPAGYAGSPQQGPPSAASRPPAPYFGSPYAQQSYPPPYGWQPQPQEVPRRDWRDWFIMATVVGGVGYGLYSITKRYVYPLVAPPTPDRLEQDKQAIDAQFERAFALVDQLAQDTEALKLAEKERTERLDTALSNLETVVSDLKASSKRREDDAERLRDDVKNLKDALPKALEAQREVTDGRLREVNAELKGLKTLIGQRMAPPPSPPATTTTSAAPTGAGSNTAVPTTPAVGSSYLRPSSTSISTPPAPSVVSVESENASAAGKAAEAISTPASTSTSGFVGGYSAANLAASTGTGTSTSTGTTLPSLSTTGKASIPAWQRAMATKTNGTGSSSSSSAQPEASSSS